MTTETENQPRRQVYLVRIWQESGHGWRYSVEPADGRDHPRRGFGSLPALLAYLDDTLPANDRSGLEAEFLQETRLPGSVTWEDTQ
jgi:hypothetical protein